MEAKNVTTISKVNWRKKFIINGQCCKDKKVFCKLNLSLKVTRKKQRRKKKGKSSITKNVFIKRIGEDSVLKGSERSQKNLERSGG